MSGHTPGPWVCVHQPSRDAEIATVVWVEDWCVGVLTPGFPGGNYRDVEFGLSIADAHLIASAPDMLAALRKAVILLAGASVHAPELEPMEAYEAVSKAISKATGKQPAGEGEKSHG